MNSTGNGLEERDTAGDALNLYNLIDRDGIHALNIAEPSSSSSDTAVAGAAAAKHIVKQWADRDDTTVWVDSGVDDQIIIHVPFVQPVRLQSIAIKLGRGEVRPHRLRIYANHPHIVDFSEAENTRSQLDFSLLEETGVVEYPLKVSSFSSVSSLSLFFSESPGEDVSRIYFLGFKGTSTTLRREGTKILQVPTPDRAEADLDGVRDKVGGVSEVR